ncbi:hypothetical protein ER308_16330 [Egibacter rhizosphaerae]|uniref:Uncharacterized protein n=1 Tax=Egibacter rhizosphaerae TaxID=1670831 RepID=A0A411YIG5_9ACTN|nr:hypothetical protein [Egibacter rhizosphaerae]QBI20987.1 hypothetical protein ER308_16330 [Egibacter rhizosphaerae]
MSEVARGGLALTGAALVAAALGALEGPWWTVPLGLVAAFRPAEPTDPAGGPAHRAVAVIAGGVVSTVGLALAPDDAGAVGLALAAAVPLLIAGAVLLLSGGRVGLVPFVAGVVAVAAAPGAPLVAALSAGAGLAGGFLVATVVDLAMLARARRRQPWPLTRGAHGGSPPDGLAEPRLPGEESEDGEPPARG